MSALDSNRFPLFSAILSPVVDDDDSPVLRRALRRYISQRHGDAMVERGDAIKGCLNCGRNLEKANCGRVFGREHEIAYQLTHVERVDKEDAASLAPRDMHIYATGCYPAKSDATNQMLASRGELEKVRARVEAHAYRWRA